MQSCIKSESGEAISHSIFYGLMRIKTMFVSNTRTVYRTQIKQFPLSFFTLNKNNNLNKKSIKIT